MTDPRAYLTVAILLFTIGMAGFLIRRNLLVILLSLELVLNAGALTLITFARTAPEAEQALQGHTFYFLVVALAAAESAVGLSLIIALYRHKHRLNTDDLAELKG